VFTLVESFYDQGEVEKAEEKYMELLEAREDSTEPLSLRNSLAISFRSV
jgi:hypothetical protein